MDKIQRLHFGNAKIHLEVKFWEYPDDLDWADDEEVARYFASAGMGDFFWEPGTDVNTKENDLLIRANHGTPFYPLKGTPFYIRAETARRRLHALMDKARKRKRRDHALLDEAAYLQDMLKKWEVLASFLSLRD